MVHTFIYVCTQRMNCCSESYDPISKVDWLHCCGHTVAFPWFMFCCACCELPTVLTHRFLVMYSCAQYFLSTLGIYTAILNESFDYLNHNFFSCFILLRFGAAHSRVGKHCCCPQLCFFLMAIELFLYSCNRLTSDTVNLQAVNNLLGS